MKASPTAGFPRTRSRGFTLIEMLVVVAIIAILAGLLLPALSRAKAAGHSAACKKNLRQWGLGSRIYLDDFQAYAPYALPDAATAAPLALLRWYDRLSRSLNIPDLRWRWYPGWDAAPPPKGIQFCPGLAWAPLIEASGAIREIGCYGYNSIGLGGGVAGSKLGLGGETLDPFPASPVYSPENFRFIRENDVIVPSDMIAIGDGIIGAGFWGGADAFLPGALWANEDLSPHGYELAAILGTTGNGPFSRADVALMQAAIQRRHRGRWNVVLCDGHVESLKSRDLFDLRQDPVRQRWNSDHLPHRELQP